MTCNFIRCFFNCITWSVFSTDTFKWSLDWIFNYSSCFSSPMFCCRFDFFIRFLMTCSICEASENRIVASVNLFYYIIWINWCNIGRIIIQSWAVQCWWVRASCRFSFGFLADRRGTWRDLLVLKLAHPHGSKCCDSEMLFCSPQEYRVVFWVTVDLTSLAILCSLSSDVSVCRSAAHWRFFPLLHHSKKKNSVNTSYRKAPPWHGQSLLDHTFLFLMVDVNITQGC